MRDVYVKLKLLGNVIRFCHCFFFFFFLRSLDSLVWSGLSSYQLKKKKAIIIFFSIV